MARVLQMFKRFCFLDSAGDICPEKECDCQISSDRKAWFQAIWKEHFTMLVAPITTPALEGKVTISLLNGDSTTIDIGENMTVSKLNTEIKRQMGVEVNEQKLLFEGKELQKYKNYKITAGCRILLVKLLYALPQSFDEVVFDLNWQYPSDVGVDKEEKRDYLDASCFLFKGDYCEKIIDYVDQDPRKKELMKKFRVRKTNWGVFHDGDRMDDKKRLGHHIIRVSLKDVPTKISHMFFTLSAWNSPNISKYPNPTLNFYDSSKPGVSLCDTTFSHASNSQAIVMCSLSRSSLGTWVVYQNGKISNGNVKNYDPLKSTISKLIREGY